jgi:hypothetical protein
MAAFFLLVSMALQTQGQAAKAVTDAEKTEFIELLKKLPMRGEFFTQEAVDRAGRYLRVLLALTEKDIEKYELYPFLALSRGLCEANEHRSNAVKHFGTIAHPKIKMAWGVMLFDEKSASPDIVKYLRAALESKEQSKFLSEALGPGFEGFKIRLKDYESKQKK